VLQLGTQEDIFSIEGKDREGSWNVGPRLQTTMQQVLDRRDTPAALPTNVEPSRLLNIPKLNPQDNPLKRCIEASGILGDSLVQNKCRRVYSEYASYTNFAREYMQQIDIAQGGTIVPNMPRTLLEGIISKDPIVENVVNAWHTLLNRPVTWLFENI
jgi:hypothetical protein